MSSDLIIKTIINYINRDKKIGEFSTYNNTVQNVGVGFEEFVKGLFLDSTSYTASEKNKKYAEIFSWQGAANTPPDLILKNSYAIEIKKKTSKKVNIPLNSSYPKNLLSSDDVKISRECSEIEGGNWTKDFFYYIGESNNGDVKSIFIMDGKCYAGNSNIYSRIFDAIKDGVSNIEDIVFEKTKEIGKVKNIDPYKITDLRVRGMWNIKSPASYLPEYITNFDDKYKIYCLLEKEKYDLVSVDLLSQLKGINGVSIECIKLPDPSNLSNLKDVVSIGYK